MRFVRKPQTMDDVVARVRTSFPILRAAKLDFVLR